MSKTEAAKVLQTIRNNYRKAYAGMSETELKNLFEIWVSGLQRMESKYIYQALDWYVYESTDGFPPTIGQFLAKAKEFKIQYERKNPVIRNSWEIKE